MVRVTCSGLDQSGKTKIGQMWLTLWIKENVSRLDVSMQNTVLMSVVNGARDFAMSPPPAGSTSTCA